MVLIVVPPKTVSLLLRVVDRREPLLDMLTAERNRLEHATASPGEA